MKTSLNDNLILEPYKTGQGLKSEVRNGFAFVSQKGNLVGLKLLADAKLNDGSYIYKDMIAYIPEDHLSTLPWAKEVKTSKGIDNQEFIVVPLRSVVFIDDLEEVKS